MTSSLIAPGFSVVKRLTSHEGRKSSHTAAYVSLSIIAPSCFVLSLALKILMHVADLARLSRPDEV